MNEVIQRLKEIIKAQEKEIEQLKSSQFEIQKDNRPKECINLAMNFIDAELFRARQRNKQFLKYLKMLLMYE